MNPGSQFRSICSTCLIGGIAGAILLSHWESMPSQSLPEMQEVCVSNPSAVALFELEAACNQCKYDDFWFSPASVHPFRLDLRREETTVALVGDAGCALLDLSPSERVPAHGASPLAPGGSLQHLPLLI